MLLTNFLEKLSAMPDSIEFNDTKLITRIDKLTRLYAINSIFKKINTIKI